MKLTVQIYAYNSSTVTPLHPRTSRLLQKRLFALHFAMASDVFGLVVGNVGLASSKSLLDQLRKQLKKASKKSYTLSVGRLNPAKLANFAEIECFVLVGCAEGGVVDSKDFLIPIITPWELLLALKGPENDWEPDKWTLDLGRVLAGMSIHPNSATPANELAEARERDADETQSRDPADPEFSLISGTLRSKKTYGTGSAPEQEAVEGIKDLTLRNQDFSLSKLESAGSELILFSFLVVWLII
jgi:diphthamide biosynthesis protein 2